MPKRRRRHDVAFYIPSIGPLLAVGDVAPTGGAETQLMLVSRGLARRGARVAICATSVPGAGIPATFHGVTVELSPPPVRQGLFVNKVRELLEMWRVLRAADADVLVTRIAGFHVGVVGLVARATGRRFAYSSASLFDFNFEAVAESRRDRILYRIGIALATDIVVQTDEQAALCRRRFGRAATVIKSVAEAAPLRTAPEAFVWVGRAVWYKRPHEFLALARAVSEARFRMIAVESPDSGLTLKELRDAAADIPNLELLEPRPRPALASLLDQAVAVVNTSTFEGMPNVNLEGWARGVPALTLFHDPDGVIERHGIGVFAHGSAEALAEGARWLWRERHASDELAHRCRDYVATHHGEGVAVNGWWVALGLGAESPAIAEATPGGS
jgi:glycosyltransferase involved in cell wall biosynthesis